MSTSSKSKSKVNKLKKFATQCRRYWPLFVISLFLSGCFAAFYLYTAQPQYTRDAQLLIKEESKNRTTATSDLNAITDLGMFSSNSNVNNELGRIQSPSLLEQVIKDLHLDVDYMKVDFLRKRTLYGIENPIVVEVLGLEDNESCEFQISLDSASYVTYARKDIENDAKSEKEDNADADEKPIKKASTDDADKPKFTITELKFGNDKIEGSWSGSLETSKTLHKKLRILVSYNPNFKGYRSDVSDIAFPNNILVSRRGLVKCIESCKSKLGVTLVDKKSTILNLSYSDANATRAEDVLLALIKAYNDNLLEGKNQIAQSTSQFISDRLSLIERELGSVDENISAYKSRNLTPDVEEVAKIHLGKASQAQDKVSELDAQLAMLEYIRDFIANNHDKQFLPAVTNITNAVIEKSIEDYNALLLKRNNLAANSSDRNPMVVSYDQNLTDMAKAILVSIDSQIDAIDSQIVNLRKTEAKSKAKIASTPMETKYLLGVERQQKVKESLYLFLLQKREENELGQAFSAYNNQIIAQPNGKMEATSPIKKNIIVVAFLLGLLIPAGIVWMLTSSKGKIDSLDDLGEIQAQVLGEVPFKETKIVVNNNKQDKANRAFRDLRTILETPGAEGEAAPRTLMFTDLDSASGKSYTATNVAKAFALKQKKVAMVNFDCKDSYINSLTGDKSGVFDFLSQKDDASSWQNFIHQISAENLFLMPTGETPENPSDLFNETKIQSLINSLKANYDMIIFNCPSSVEESANVLLGKLIDKTVFVLSSDSNVAKSTELINNYVEENKFNGISVVFNNRKKA